MTAKQQITTYNNIYHYYFLCNFLKLEVRKGMKGGGGGWTLQEREWGPGKHETV
jgi:hypothetical protein